jgi:hypothetical protein
MFCLLCRFLLLAGYLFWGSKIFPLGPQNRRHVRSSRHVLIERKAKSNAGGLHVLLIIMWPDTTLAIPAPGRCMQLGYTGEAEWRPDGASSWASS